MGVSAQRQVHIERVTLARLIYQRNRVFTSHIHTLLHDVTLVELQTHVRAHSQPVPHTQTQQRYYLNTNYFVHEQSILDKRQKINDNLRDAEAAAAAAAAAKLQKQHAKFQTELFTQEKELCTLQFLLQLLNDAEQEEKLQDLTDPL